MDLPNAIEEGSDASANVTGNGETSGDRPEPQTVNVGQSKGLGWDGFVQLITVKNTFAHPIRIAYYPKPEGELIFTEKGNIIVRIGDESYQTSDGKYHSI